MLTRDKTVTGLAFLHSQGVIHRDIKGDNILLPTTGALEVKVADFGVATKLNNKEGGTEVSLSLSLSFSFSLSFFPSLSLYIYMYVYYI